MARARRPTPEARLSDTDTPPQDLWARHARQWALLGAPLRPSDEDLTIVRDVAAQVAARPRVLVLGATPEYARLPWPEGTTLLAVERSEAMARGVWPGFPSPGEGVLIDDWRTVALPQASWDLILGDGSLTTLSFPDDATALLRRVAQLLAPGGRMVLRAFLRPAVPEPASQVHADALAGRIDSFHAYKVRLAAAHQGTSPLGVSTRDVWRAWCEEGPDAARLAAATGWPPEQIGTFAAYDTPSARLCFPTDDEQRAVAHAAGLREVACVVPSYALGERFPTWVWTRGDET